MLLPLLLLLLLLLLFAKATRAQTISIDVDAVTMIQCATQAQGAWQHQPVRDHTHALQAGRSVRQTGHPDRCTPAHPLHAPRSQLQTAPRAQLVSPRAGRPAAPHPTSNSCIAVL